MAVSCTQRLPALGVSAALLRRDPFRAASAFLLTRIDLFNALIISQHNLPLVKDPWKLRRNDPCGVSARGPFGCRCTRPSRPDTQLFLLFFPFPFVFIVKPSQVCGL